MEMGKYAMCIPLALLLFLVPALTPIRSIASDNDYSNSNDNLHPPTSLFSVDASSPYCGLASVLACINAYGSPAPDDDLSLISKYVSSASGSTLSDLQQLSHDCGVPSYVASGLLPQDLDYMTLPAVLHVRTSVFDTQFGHWVAFLGINGDKYRIFDINTGLTELDCGKLSTIWDGRLLIIGASSPPLLPHSISRCERLLLLSVFVISLILRRVSNFKMSAFVFPASQYGSDTSRHFFAFGAVALIGSVVFHAISPMGIIFNTALLPPIHHRHFREAACIVDTGEMKNIISAGRATIIDARLANDHANGTIPGAISLPFDSTIHEREVLLKSISLGRSIVVFCQNESCGFADDIAEFLLFNGYKHVCIFRNGYMGWKSAVK